MKKIKTRNKILISILFIICLFLLKNRSEVSAANYIWPVGGSNYAETYIEYWYQDRYYDSTAYDKKYNYAPYEQSYYANEYHYGVDITGIKGTTYELISICNGKVVATSADRWHYAGINFPDKNKRKSSYDGGGYGNYIVIQDSSNGKCFMYAHLKAGSINLKRGDTVKLGQKIGIMGSSGDSGHMHLHFEVRKNINTIVGANGCYLINTTGYNIQTENPVNYIGNAPQIKEPEPMPTPVPTPTPAPAPAPVPDPTPIVNPAKREKITFTRYTNYRNINIYFDKPVTIKTIPTLNITVGDETRTAKFVGIINDDKKLVYQIDYNQFNMFNSGEMYIECKGSVIDKNDGKTVVSCNISNVTVGNLPSYKILHTYENMVMDKLGDVNADGFVSSIDASIVLNLYIKNIVGEQLTSDEEIYMTRADVNKDGRVNSSDASLILSYYADLASSNIKDENTLRIIKCDINDDGSVTVKDYEILNNAIRTCNTDKKYDLNEDNEVDQYDVYYLKRTVIDLGSRQ